MISSLLAFEFDLLILSNGALYQTVSNLMMGLSVLVLSANSASSGFVLPVEVGVDLELHRMMIGLVQLFVWVLVARL